MATVARRCEGVGAGARRSQVYKTFCNRHAVCSAPADKKARHFAGIIHVCLLFHTITAHPIVCHRNVKQKYKAKIG